MSAYLIINILIIIVPLLFTFEKKVNYFKKLPNVFTAVISVGAAFILWDISAVRNGDWSFNPAYVSGSRISGLPPEEILFFITVPYSIIFIYESLRIYIKERMVSVNKLLMMTGILIFGTASYLFSDLSYTSNVMIAAMVVLILLLLKGRSVDITNIFFITLLVSFIPFIIVNYFLTSMPILEYNPEAITGIRFLTIPVEDFFYSFSMTGGWLIAYSFSGKRIFFKNN
ncbi:MAG: lycopene cyclase domain-containing protein [Bacteroidetes bacterium]|nr:lycopene cyclase domain-containing protein [Bacteroidota bacterium]